MNSFVTRDASLRAPEQYPALSQDVPFDVLQTGCRSSEPTISFQISILLLRTSSGRPPATATYTVLQDSGMADNLGATLDTALLGWFVASGAPFALEAADRTAADRKGGHLAASRTGGLTLRDVAQIRLEDSEAFQDIEHHRYFNTNNLWINLRALKEILTAGHGGMDLPLIVNRKTVDPSDATSTAVIQLESAMGSALSSWPRARAIRVPRSRFRPVKTTNDLLVTRSDAYRFDERSHLELEPTRHGNPPVADLDPAYYTTVADFDARFPSGVPSLIGCDRLTVKGDIWFEAADVVFRGNVILNHDDAAPLVVAGTAHSEH